MTTLTKKQLDLMRQLEEVADLTGHSNFTTRLAHESDSDIRTMMLEEQRNRLIRDWIVSQYVLVDEHLGAAVARYFFGAKRSFPDLWRTKKFQRFNYYILEKLTTLEKLALVRDLRRVPRKVNTFVHALNDLRNALAHSFYPENLRGNRVSYKKKSIFSIEGFSVLVEDAEDAQEYFFEELNYWLAV